MNEIAITNKENLKKKPNKVNKSISENIGGEEKLLVDSYNIMSEEYKNQLNLMYKEMKSKWKSCNRVVEEIETKFCDFVKKDTVHKVSQIRNFQFDTDSFIKKCGLFDEELKQNQEQNQEPKRKNSEESINSSVKKKEIKKIGKFIWSKA